MQRTVFYSWQSDLPGNSNRYFIAEALKKAAATIHGDDRVEESPRVDSDTSGVAGSPDIAHTILAKIDQADVFVCDLSIINDYAKRLYVRKLIRQEILRLSDITNQTERISELKNLTQSTTDRPTPNPNVLFELGYAWKTGTLGPNRILMVMNEAYGERDSLPFDLRMKRVHTFNLSENANKTQAKKELQQYFEVALSAIFAEIAKQ